MPAEVTIGRIERMAAFLAALSAVLFALPGRQRHLLNDERDKSESAPAVRAAVLGVCAGLYFRLSATFGLQDAKLCSSETMRGRRRS
jgi:hypothetical protein